MTSNITEDTPPTSATKFSLSPTPTAALPVIWDKQDEFKQAAERAHGLAGKLAETSQGGDVQATLSAFAALGKEGCGSCHETFRKKQD